jgi:two-component system response regulator QseB
VVEDSVLVAQFLETGLRENGYLVTLVETLEAARKSLSESSPDMILLDRKLPDGDGLEIVDELRRQGSNVPIMMLTGLGDVDSRVEGVRTGADDYLAKPFTFDELTARIDKLIKRSPSTRGLMLGPIHIDLDGHRVWIDEEPISLTAKEFAILLILATNAGRVISGSQLLAQVWGIHDDPESNLLAVHINNIRAKLGPELLQTIRGVGYTLDPDRDLSTPDTPESV